MEVGDGFLLVASLFQLVVGLVLMTAGPGPRHRAMAILLFVNALQPLQVLHLSSESPIERMRQAADVLTALLIVVAMRPHTGRFARWIEIPVLVATLVEIVLVIAAPDLATLYDRPLRAAPYYAAMGAMVLVGARGDEPDQWLATAFLPRAIYLGLTASAEGSPFWLLDIIGKRAMLLLAITGLAILARRARMRIKTVAVASALVGLVSILSLPAVSDFTSYVLNDGMSLYYVRPLILIVAFVPRDLSAIMTRTTVGAIVVFGSAFALGKTSLRAPADAEIALALGCIVIALFEANRPALWGREPSARSVAPAARGPQWQRILVALAGSSAGPPQFEHSQQGLARATGISVKRISEFPEDMAKRAEARLDTYVPGWRSETAAVPRLVEAREGLLPDAPGPRVFYRLTPWGERLASAIAARHEPPIVKMDLTIQESGQP